MKNISQFHHLLPPPVVNSKGHNMNFITIVRDIWILTKVALGYSKITYQEFVDDFPKYVKLTNFEGDPRLYVQSGIHKGELTRLNVTTLSHTWVKRHGFNEAMKEFKQRYVYTVAQNTMRDIVANRGERTEQNSQLYDDFYDLQRVVFSSQMTTKDKAYTSKAIQESISMLQQRDKDNYDLSKDYIQVIDEHNAHMQGNSDSPFNPDTDSIIQRFNDLQQKMKKG